MIGILGGMGTQAGLDFCNKLAKFYRGKLDQDYPMFVLFNKSNTPRRPENLKKYNKILKELVVGCKMLEKKRVLTIPASDNIIRLSPPLIIGKKEVDIAVSAIEKVLSQKWLITSEIITGLIIENSLKGG